MALDIKTLLGDVGVPFWTVGKNVSEGWTSIRCPVPGCGDRSNHGAFSSNGRAYSCFKCGKHSVKRVIAALTDWETATRLIAEYDNILRFDENTHKDRALAVEWPPLGVYKTIPSLHAQYLKERDYDIRQLRDTYGIQCCYHNGDFNYRVVIPVYENGRLVSYLGRDVTGKSPLKYKNLSERKSVLPVKECVYNIDNIHETAIICEGVFDAWRFGVHGVALFGLQFTTRQTNILGRKLKRAFIFFDNEAQAQTKGVELAEALSLQGVDTEIVRHSDFKDPGEIPQQVADEIKKELFS